MAFCFSFSKHTSEAAQLAHLTAQQQLLLSAQLSISVHAGRSFSQLHSPLGTEASELTLKLLHPMCRMKEPERCGGAPGLSQCPVEP